MAVAASPVDVTSSPARTQADLAGSGADVLAGDNAWISRTDGVNAWDGSLTRRVTLFDVETTTSPAAVGTSAPDEMYGGDGNVHLHGQGGNEVTLEGNAGDDVIEGNHGDDLVVGGPGNDDLIGGGSANDGVLDGDRDPSGLLDGRDTIIGDTDTPG